jgi:hypothetical protein
MKNLLAALLISSATTGAMAVEDYNTPPAGDAQYATCVQLSNAWYTGGHHKSPVRGQTKAQAYCICLWNETPEDFTGDLARFAETTKGKRAKAMCETYADWE